MGLWNTAYNRWCYWNGRADSAWAQALGPTENEDEMSSNRLHTIHLVSNDASLADTHLDIFRPLLLHP